MTPQEQQAAESARTEMLDIMGRALGCPGSREAYLSGAEFAFDSAIGLLISGHGRPTLEIIAALRQLRDHCRERREIK